ncbi:hypothetical protein CBL_10057 [Carabus blaptoides fortunei]
MNGKALKILQVFLQLKRFKGVNPKKSSNELKCFNYHMTGHCKRNCPKKLKSKQELGLAVINATALIGDPALLGASEAGEWIANSGASQHMTKCKGLFKTWEPFGIIQVVLVSYVQRMSTLGKGNIDFKFQTGARWIRNIMKDVCQADFEKINREGAIAFIPLLPCGPAEVIDSNFDDPISNMDLEFESEDDLPLSHFVTNPKSKTCEWTKDLRFVNKSISFTDDSVSIISVNIETPTETRVTKKSSYRDYWSAKLQMRDPFILSSMSRDWFCWLLFNMHVNENSVQPKKAK